MNVTKVERSVKRSLAAGLVLVFGHMVASAQIQDIQVIAHQDIQLDELLQQDEGWWAYQVDAIAGIGTLCCFSGRLHGPLRSGCTLGQPARIYGTTDLLPDSSHIVVFIYQQQGRIQEMLTLGDRCPVNGAGRPVHWLTDISTAASAQWLARIARTEDDDASGQAVMALARHEGAMISETLYQLALAADEARARHAVEGLGLAPDFERLAMLKRLLSERGNGDARLSINHALHRHNTDGAWALLHEIATSDQDEDQRTHATHWLGESKRPDNLAVLVDIAAKDHSEQVQMAAVHALTEMPLNGAMEALLSIAKGHGAKDVMAMAWYGLMRKWPELAQREIEPMLRGGLDEQIVVMALAGLAELPSAQSTLSLIRLAGETYPQVVRRAALQWLIESDDPRALVALESSLR